jgi:Zn-dependent protease
MAVVAAILFFGSLLLHELGHAVQARRDGIAIEGITLWVFGGVARLRGQMPSAGAELRVALAGPAVSLVIGVVFLLAALVLPLPAGVDGVAFWVGQINLYLLVFNMVPALPLDGGRVLRAILWARRRDFVSATRSAGTLGRGFGQLMIAGGVALVIFVGDFGGVWLSFLGFFLLDAAEAELETAAAREVLGDLRVSQLMVRNPVSVGADATLEHFIDSVFLPSRHAAFPVMDGERAVGIVSFRSALEVSRATWPVTLVREVMIDAEDASVAPDDLLSAVVPDLAQGELRRRVVCRRGRLVGLLSWTDVSRVLEVRLHVAAADLAATREPRRIRLTESEALRP